MVDKPAWQDALDAQEAECRQLRTALIAMGRMIPGVRLAEDVSSDFLAGLPDEMAHYHLSTPTQDTRDRVKVLEEALEAFLAGDIDVSGTALIYEGSIRLMMDRARTALGNKETDRG